MCCSSAVSSSPVTICVQHCNYIYNAPHSTASSPFMIHTERVKRGGSLSSFRTHGHGQGVHEVMVENVFLYGKSQNIGNCYSIVLWLTGRGRLPSSPPLVWAGQARVPLSPISEPLFVPLSCWCWCWARVCTSPSLVTSQQSKIEILLFPGGNYYFPVQCPARGRGRGRAGHWSATRDRASLAAISILGQATR